MDSRLIQLLIHELSGKKSNENIKSRLQALDCLAYLLQGGPADAAIQSQVLDCLGSAYSTLCAIVVDEDGESRALNESREFLVHACDKLPQEYTDFLIRNQRDILAEALQTLLDMSTANEAGFYDDKVKLVLRRNSRLKNLLNISNGTSGRDQAVSCQNLTFHLNLTLDFLKSQAPEPLTGQWEVLVDLCLSAIFLQCSRDINVSGTASSLFSFLVSLRDQFNRLPPQDIWDIFLTLSKCNEAPLQTVGFRLAVLYIRGQQNHLMTNSFFQDELITQPALWTVLHGALLSESATLQKYALYVLSQCVKAANRPVDVTVDDRPLFCFRPQSKETKIKEFQLFITIYEIVIVDSSIHQSEAALTDLTSLLRAPLSAAHVEPAWSCLIISRGLSTSMDSIKKLMIDYVISLPFEAMPVLGFDADTIPNYFLPIASQAHHFSITQQQQASQYYCPYGDLMSAFLSRLVAGVGNASSCNHKLVTSRVRILLNRALSFLCCKWNAYDLSRIFILSGLADGCCQLKNSDLVLIGVEEIGLLSKLLASPSESPMGGKIRSVACIRLLAATVDLTDRQVLGAFIDTVASIEFDESLLMECFVEFGNGSVMTQLRHGLNMQLDGQLQKYLGLLSDYNSDLSRIKVTAAMCKWANTESFTADPPFSNLLFSNTNSLNCAYIERALLEIYCYLGIHLNETSSPFSLSEFDNPTQARIVYLFAKVSNRYFQTTKDIWTSIFKKTDGKILVPDEATVEQARLTTLAPLQTKDDESVATMVNELISLIDYSPKADVFTIKESDRLNDQLLAFAFDEIDRNYCGNEDLLLRLVETINARFPYCHSSQPRLSMCRYLYNALDKYFSLHSGTTQLVQLITETVRSSIFALIEDGFSIADRKLHQEYIRFLLCRPVVRMTTWADGHGTELETALIQSIDLLIKQGFARKAILPQISAQLYYGSVGHGYDYHRPWVGKLFIRLHTFLQTTEPLFKSDGVMTQLYSTWWIANGQEKSMQLASECFGPYSERFTRAFVLSALASLKAKDEVHRVFAKHMIEWLLESPQSMVFKPIQGKDDNERIRVFSFQLLALLVVQFNYQPQELRHIFLKCLKKEPSPWVRCYMEWIISRTLLLLDASNSVLLDKEFFHLLDDSETVARYLVSLHVIGSLVAKRIEPPQLFFKRLFDDMIPFATSNRALIRHSAISQLLSLIPTAHARSRQEKLSIVPPGYDEMLGVLKSHIEAAPQYSKFKSGDAIVWDVKDDFNLSGIAGGVLCRISEKRSFPDIIPKRVFDEIIVEQGSTEVPIGRDYIAEEETNSEQELPTPPFMKLSGAGVNGGRGELVAQVGTEQHIFSTSSEEDEKNGQVHVPLQTKSGLWTDIIEAAGGTTRNVDSRRGDLIVVASLVDKAPNLGGICRLSDVLGAKLLCIDNLAVVKTREFQNVAVTADRWMPMQQVPVDEIETYLKWAKIELGYTLVGLEQTDESIVLDNHFQFPEKSIVLLGKEREGIPANLLAILDCCLEIRQLGVIRSMNIQTATAVLVYAYSIQHCT